MKALALALALLAAPAAAQTPDAYSSPEGMRQFQLCRAAIFYHLDDKARGASQIPVKVGRVMREWSDLLMQETLWRYTPGTIDEGVRSIRFAEQFFIGFSQVLREERETLLDPVRRDAILYDCMPFMWVSLQTTVEDLMAWRSQAIDAPPRPAPAEILKRWDEGYRRLAE